PNGGTPSATGGGLMAETILPDTAHNAFQYDALGRQTRTTNGRGFATDYVYNALDGLIQVTDADGNSTTNLFDANDKVIETRRSNRRPELSASTGLPTGTTLDLAPIVDFFKYDGL